jgi:oxygen-dependent protoporphyrinogen oxidase
VDPRHIVVVGAGFAGLEAASRLAAAGVRVTLLEREARAGGRMAEVALHGVRFDPGAPAFARGDGRVRELIREQGLAAAIEPLPISAYGQLHRDEVREIRPQTLGGVARLPGAGLLRGLLRLPRLPRLLARYAPLLDRERPERAARLDDRSATEFGRLYLGRGFADRWIEPALAETVLGNAAETSRVLFLLRPGLGRDAAQERLRTGLGALADALAVSVPTHFGVEVAGIAERPGGGLRVEVSGERMGPLEADAVVLATPPAEAARLGDRLLGFAEREHFAQARGVAAMVLTVALKARPGLAVRRIRIPPVEELPLAHVACELGGKSAAIPEGHVVVSLVASDAFSRARLSAPADVVEKELLVHGERIEPALGGAAIFTQLTRWAFAYPRFDVGRYRAIGRFQRLQEIARQSGRRLYFAGDHLVGPSIEGALASGARAAAAALDDLGISRAPARRR